MPILKCLFFIAFLFLINKTTAQRGFLLVKKNNKTIETYTTSSPIVFTHRFGYNVQGILANIKKTSFSVLQYTIQKKIDPRGFVYFDTIYNGYTLFALTDIKSLPRRKQKGKLVKMLSGASLLGSGGITLLSIVNGIKFKDKAATIGKNILYKGGGLFLIGTGLGKLYPPQYMLRKKFSVTLMEF